jgi:3-hydroxyisobutyrate dehydrogenase
MAHAHENEHVGLIGLGRVGLPLAQNLLRAGYQVWGFRRSESREFEDAGGHRAASCADIAAHADTVLTCLPSAAALAEVVGGPTGLIHRMRLGSVLVELSTLALADKDEQRRALEHVGAAMVDCPISGTPPMVAERHAALFASGDEATLHRCRPLLDALSTTVTHVGPFGTGSKLKYIANLLVAAHTLAAAEAMKLAQHTGIDPATAMHVLQDSAGGSLMFTARAPLVLEERYLPAPGPVDTMRECLDAAYAEIKAAGTSTPVFDLVSAWYDQAAAAGLGQHDIASVAMLMAGSDTPTPAHATQPRPGRSE